MRNYQFLPIATLLVIDSFVNAAEIVRVAEYPATIFFDQELFMFVDWDGHIFPLDIETHECECELCRSFE